jgi:hypothetical protein
MYNSIHYTNFYQLTLNLEMLHLVIQKIGETAMLEEKSLNIYCKGAPSQISADFHTCLLPNCVQNA